MSGCVRARVLLDQQAAGGFQQAVGQLWVADAARQQQRTDHGAENQHTLLIGLFAMQACFDGAQAVANQFISGRAGGSALT